jgi:hypothetical protein
VPVRSRRGAGAGFAEDGCEAFRGNPGLFQVCASVTPDEQINAAAEATIKVTKRLGMLKSSAPAVTSPLVG